METIHCPCGSNFESKSLKMHVKTKKHLEFVNGPNANHTHFNYFKCDCGSLIKKTSIYMHRETDIHKYYLSQFEKDKSKNLKKEYKAKIKFGPKYCDFDYFHCECGSYIKKKTIYVHKKTKIHNDYIASLKKD